jgi:hypothetical protein
MEARIRLNTVNTNEIVNLMSETKKSIMIPLPNLDERANGWRYPLVGGAR